MWYACEIGNENTVKYLFEHGANIFKEDENGEIPLVRAFVNGNNNLIDYFLKNDNVIKILKEIQFRIRIEEYKDHLYVKVINIFIDLRLRFACVCPNSSNIENLIKKV